MNPTLTVVLSWDRPLAHRFFHPGHPLGAPDLNELAPYDQQWHHKLPPNGAVSLTFFPNSIGIPINQAPPIVRAYLRAIATELDDGRATFPLSLFGATGAGALFDDHAQALGLPKRTVSRAHVVLAYAGRDTHHDGTLTLHGDEAHGTGLLEGVWVRDNRWLHRPRTGSLLL